MFHRACNLSKSNSFFLFGARGTGKTTLLNHALFLKDALRIDLLIPELEERYSLQPSLLLEQTHSLKKGTWVVIDEVQKVPKLLDLVHKSIESNGIKYALTGSSARKLKRGGADMLAG